MMHNILITSAGRRVSLVMAFQRELKSRFPEAHVFTADMNPEWSSACRVSDGFFVLPRATDDMYIPALRRLCLEKQIGLVIPTIDTELLISSRYRAELQKEGVFIAISDPELVMQSRDKRKTIGLFNSMGIDIPCPVDKWNPTFPLFIKPYDGSLSKNILLVRNESEWSDALTENEKLMFMEYLSPDEYQEFTVDAYYNSKGVLKCLVPRRRVEVRGGEISKGRTEKGHLYKYLVQKFLHLKGARGCLTMQFFEHIENRRVVGIEINPRFGGGFPLSFAAKANYPGFLIDEYILGEKIDFFDSWVDQRVMLRYDAEVILDANDFTIR